MNWTVVQRILGLLLMMFSLTMLPPIVFSIYYNDHSWLPFVEGFGLTLAAGFHLLAASASLEERPATARWLPCRRRVLDGTGHLRCGAAVFL